MKTSGTNGLRLTPREESRQGHGTFGGLRGPSAGGLGLNCRLLGLLK